MPPPDQSKRSFQAPKGTRDFYPPELLRRRYIEKAWRDTAIRHGFEEIDGPTFEHTELYTVKSGEAILGEVFNVFSGKDQEQVKEAAGGRAPYALRPEFTPTLARMYAAQAGSLPKPTKWFWQQNCFRAERPQRGRLREFGQWNVDFLGGDESAESRAAADSEVIATCAALLRTTGLKVGEVIIKVCDRRLIASLGLIASRIGMAEATLFDLLDRRSKMEPNKFADLASSAGLDIDALDHNAVLASKYTRGELTVSDFRPKFHSDYGDEYCRNWELDFAPLFAVEQAIARSEVGEWCQLDFSVVRGLAYYTGMVFEVHEASGAERAIAGGGRYDNLIELFGGPPTPAVGFGMGDVVLSNILQDKGLMPEGRALLDRLSEPGASLRPDVFVISNGQPESDAALRPLVADLRRKNLHARHTYKTTKNIGKLLKEASDAHARFGAIIESAAEATLKDLETGTQEKVPLAAIADRAKRP
ncbi:MAG: histidine--tRNA ligase [Phycisphaerales bacterium]